MDYVLMGLDGAGVGMCAPACFGMAFGGAALQAACSWDSLAASSLQVIDGIIQAQGAGGKALAGLMGGAGIALPILIGGIKNEKSVLTGAGATTTKGKAKLSACITMATLAMDLVTRMMSMKNQNASQSSACQAIIGLTQGTNPNTPGSSSGATSSSSGNTIAPTTTGTVTAPVAGATGSTAASQAQTMTACLAGGTSATTCSVQSLGTPVPAQLAGASGALGPLSGTGVQALAQQAGSIIPALANAVGSPSSTPSSVMSALGNSAGLSPDATDALSKYADAIAASGLTPFGSDVAAALYKSAGGAAGSSGAGDGKGDKGGEDPLAGFAADQGGGPDGPGQMAFGSGQAMDVDSRDIFHRDMPRNTSLFQIITHRYGRVKERVDKLDWSAPFNHAMSR